MMFITVARLSFNRSRDLTCIVHLAVAMLLGRPMQRSRPITLTLKIAVAMLLGRPM